MKVLWILNSPLPEAISLLTGQPHVSKSTGSWVCALVDALVQNKDLQLFIAAPSPLVRHPMTFKGTSVTHFILPPDGNYWKLISDQVQPDLTHIHGTEYPLSLDFVKACGSQRVVVSLQGLVSEYRYFFWGGIPESLIRRYISLRDIVRKDSLLTQRDNMSQRGDIEIQLLRSVRHVIGRTFWDKSVSLGINPNLHYHLCNEALREPFYSGSWSSDTCIPHRIFLSQGHNPIKGAHTLIEALPAVVERYPDTSVHIAGPNILRCPRLKDRILRSGFGQYLSDLLHRNHLSDVVHFIGELDADSIKKELLEANVYALVSAIENSPNSLCEAQILGVPSIASNVGGTSALIPDESCGLLYPVGDRNALAERILFTFDHSASFDNTKMRQTAAQRHNREQIIRDLMRIYDEVAN